MPTLFSFVNIGYNVWITLILFWLYFANLFKLGYPRINVILLVLKIWIIFYFILYCNFLSCFSVLFFKTWWIYFVFITWPTLLSFINIGNSVKCIVGFEYILYRPANQGTCHVFSCYNLLRNCFIFQFFPWGIATLAWSGGLCGSVSLRARSAEA